MIMKSRILGGVLARPLARVNHSVVDYIRPGFSTRIRKVSYLAVPNYTKSALLPD